MISLDKGNDSCNTPSEISRRICVPNKAKNFNVNCKM